MRLSTAALALAVSLAGCASNKPKPTLAGSTPVLQLLRDWRGVWKGSVKDSPMGSMTYTLHIEKAGAAVRVKMAPQRESGLESMKQVYELINFERGTPHIRYALSQRATAQKGELVYRDDLSDEERAVFCPEEEGCDKLKLTLVKLSETRVAIKSQVHESAHSEVEVSFASADVPKPGAEVLEDDADSASAVGSSARAKESESAEPKADKDLYLEEHLDKDLSLGKGIPADEAPAPAATPAKGKGKKGQGN